MKQMADMATAIMSLKRSPDFNIPAASWVFPSALSLAENLVKAELTPRSMKPARIEGMTKDRENKP